MPPRRNPKALLVSLLCIFVAIGAQEAISHAFLAHLRSALGRPGGDVTSILDALRTSVQISRWASILLWTALWGVLAALLRPLGGGERRSALATAALVLLAVHLAARIGVRLLPMAPPPATGVLVAVRSWSVQQLVLALGTTLLALAVTRLGKPDATRWTAFGGALLATGANLALTVYAATLAAPSDGLVGATDIASALRTLALVAVVGLAIRAVPRDDHAPLGSSGPNAFPLRLLAWTALGRILVMTGLQVGTVSALVSKDYLLAAHTAEAAAPFTLVSSVVLAMAFVLYLRFPSALRPVTAITIALTTVVLGSALDLSLSSSAAELYGLLDTASHATSFWGMPSLSRMEQLESTVQIAAGIAIALGLVSTCAAVVAVRSTARGLGRYDFDAAAQRVLTLVIVVALGVLGAAFATTHLPTELLLVVAAALLALGVLALVAWIGLLFGVARAIDGGPRPQAEMGAAS